MNYRGVQHTLDSQSVEKICTCLEDGSLDALIQTKSMQEVFLQADGRRQGGMAGRLVFVLKRRKRKKKRLRLLVSTQCKPSILGFAQGDWYTDGCFDVTQVLVTPLHCHLIFIVQIPPILREQILPCAM